MDFPKNICEECACKLKDVSSFIEIFKWNDTETDESENSRKQGEVIISKCEENEEDIARHFYQNCRICSSSRGLTPLEGKIQLMLLFQIFSNINNEGGMKSGSGCLICEACIKKLEEITLFINLSLCNDDRISSALSKFESVLDDSGSSLINNDSFTNSVSKSKSATAARTSTEDTLEHRFVHEIEEKHGTIDIKVEDSRDHSVSPTGEKPFKCGYCERGFSMNSYLRKHLLKHSGLKPFNCEFCGRCFAWKSHLQRHVRIHTGEKPFKCNFCDKSFSDKSSLTKHILFHNGEPFKCENCGKLFSVKSNLRRHLLITHPRGKS